MADEIAIDTRALEWAPSRWPGILLKTLRRAEGRGHIDSGGPHWHIGSITETIYHKACGDSRGARLPDTVDPREAKR